MTAFVVAVQGTVAQDFFTSLEFTDTNNNHVVLNTADAQLNVPPLDDPSLTSWSWEQVQALPIFGNLEVTFHWP